MTINSEPPSSIAGIIKSSWRTLSKGLKILLIEHRLPDKLLYTFIKLRERWVIWKLKLCSVTIRKRIRNIGIIRPLKQVGDILMLCPMAMSLKKIFPRARITLLCLDIPLIIDVAKRIPSFDFVIPNENNLNIYAIKEKYKASFDFILSPSYGDRTYDKKWKQDRSFISLLYLSIGVTPPTHYQFEYMLKDNELAFANQYKDKFGNYLIFHTDCGPFTDKRNWIDSNWQKLIDLQKIPVILIGTSGSEFQHCVDLRNKTTIHETAALIKYCRLYVGIDSGPFWFTHHFNKDAVIINGGFGPPILTKHSRSHHIFSDIECSPCLDPFGKCKYDMRCMRMITPDMVNQKIQEVLFSNTA